MAQQQLSALIVSTDASFIAHRTQIVALAGHHAIPTIYSERDYVLAGGLISYGVDVATVARRARCWRRALL
jgi:putative tryptophan/tyrosine transport system substrate-binding protein